MFKALRQRREIFSDGNTLLLTKPLLFQNTTLIQGALFRNPKSHGERRFYGFTFMSDGDHLDIPDAFSKGFFPRYLQWQGTEMRDMTLPRPSNFCGYATIESYVCHYAAIQCRFPNSNIYLLDIRAFGGIVRTPDLRSCGRCGMAIPRYDGYKSGDNAFFQFPITKEVYRLEMLNPVPGANIVGVVTVASPLFSGGRTPAERLKLHVNPNYGGGMDGAKDVAERFNGGGWVVVV